MTSSTDISGSEIAGTVSCETKDNAVDFSTKDGPQTKQPRKLFHIENTFVKSWHGIFLAAEMVMSLLGAFCVIVGTEQHCYKTTDVYFYYNIVAISCLVISIYLYGLKLADSKRPVCHEWKCFVTGKLGLSDDVCYVRLNTIEMITVGLLLLLFLIASIAVAVNTCGIAGFYAGFVFGFLCTIALAGHELVCIRRYFILG